MLALDGKMRSLEAEALTERPALSAGDGAFTEALCESVGSFLRDLKAGVLKATGS
jgi:hypothetical protein